MQQINIQNISQKWSDNPMFIKKKSKIIDIGLPGIFIDFRSTVCNSIFKSHIDKILF